MWLIHFYVDISMIMMKNKGGPERYLELNQTYMVELSCGNLND